MIISQSQPLISNRQPFESIMKYNSNFARMLAPENLFEGNSSTDGNVVRVSIGFKSQHRLRVIIPPPRDENMRSGEDSKFIRRLPFSISSPSLIKLTPSSLTTPISTTATATATTAAMSAGSVVVASSAKSIPLAAQGYQPPLLKDFVPQNQRRYMSTTTSSERFPTSKTTSSTTPQNQFNNLTNNNNSSSSLISPNIQRTINQSSIAFLVGAVEGALMEMVPDSYKASVTRVLRALNLVCLAMSVSNFSIASVTSSSGVVTVVIQIVCSMLSAYFGEKCGKYFALKLKDKFKTRIVTDDSHLNNLNTNVNNTNNSNINSIGEIVNQADTKKEEELLLPITHVHGSEGYFHTGLCILCYSEPANSISFPCCHIAICSNCADLDESSKWIGNCCYCRQTVESIMVIERNKNVPQCPVCVYLKCDIDPLCDERCCLSELTLRDGSRKFVLRSCEKHEMAAKKKYCLFPAGIQT